jgi:hypothetical protein
MAQRPLRPPIGTPLDDSSVESTYLVVTFRVPDDLPHGSVALVLKRLEADPRVYGVVDWEFTLPAAERYLHDLLMRHDAWRAMRDRER